MPYLPPTRDYADPNSYQTKQRNDLRQNAMGVLSGLSKLINALAPINQLPPEILGMVPKYQEGQTWKELVTVSGVCSYWRNTLLATPSIWTRLNGRGIEKTRAWVRRSKGLPIHLEAETSPDLQVLKFLAPHFSRLDAVILPCLKARDRSLVAHNHLAKLLRPNLLLRILHIDSSDLGGFDKPVIMGGEFPSLESLFIAGTQLLFTNLRAPNLRDAHISGTFNPTNLFDFLETSPLLEHLALRLNPFQDMSLGTQRKVVLKKIESLRFFHHGFEILQNLSLPPGGDVKMIEPLLPDQLAGTTSDYVHRLSLALDGLPMARGAGSLSFYTTGDDTCRFTSICGPNGNLELLTNEFDAPVSITLLHLFARNSFESLQDLKITDFELLSTDIQPISDFVKSLNGLRSIVMHQTSASPWLLALGSSHCPRLRDLTFKHPSPWSADYNAFFKFAKDRSEAGAPILRLAVTNRPEVPLDAVQMEMLQKYVSCVVWT